MHAICTYVYIQHHRSRDYGAASREGVKEEDALDHDENDAFISHKMRRFRMSPYSPWISVLTPQLVVSLLEGVKTEIPRHVNLK